MEPKTHSWNKTVAKNRGLSWRKNLLYGRLDVQMNPTQVRLKRINKNWTQEEMAEKVGLSTTTYSAIESGRRPVKQEYATKISSLLGLDFTKIFQPAKVGKNRFQAVRKK